MPKSKLFICGGASLPKRLNKKDIVQLSTYGKNQNVNLSLENLTNTFSQDVTDRVVDLLEIASYVFAADASTNRGRAWHDEASSESWGRDFKFVIPVHDTTFWNQKEITLLLIEILNFLSDDTFEFDFVKAPAQIARNAYFDYGSNEDWPFQNPERVIMFSGGLDSLAGTVEFLSQGSRAILVSHRAAPSMDKRQKQLIQLLNSQFPNQVFHVPVWVNKSGNLSREFSQRTRSFLFASLGLAVAQSAGANGIRFYENGIVSLNLPISDEVVRSRASRTTHPQALHLMSQLHSLILERKMEVDNPFIFHTKKEILEITAANKCANLIGHTCSCAHTGHFQSKTQWHCGACSQCIDRRVGIKAAGLERYDSETDYVSDVFMGPRKAGYDKNIAVNFARHVTELQRMSENEISAKFSLELSRAIRFFPSKSKAAQDFISMHIRYAAYAFGVLAKELQSATTQIIQGEIDPTSLIAMVTGNAHKVSIWKQYAYRISEILQNGVPAICQKGPPKDEKELQAICDGVLRGADENLTREFPFLKWSLVMTKPDWAKPELNLWIELKYIKKKTDIPRILRDISEDITKYGDSKVKVVFIIFDPNHVIINEPDLTSDIEKHEGMMVFCFR